MNDFNPPIEERKTRELILIVFNPSDWQEKAIKIASQELLKRGISHQEQKNQFNEIQEQQEYLGKLEMQQRAKEDFDLIDILFMILLFHKTLISGWSLRKEGYTLKAKRRLQVIFSVFLFIIFSLVSATLTHDDREDKKLKEIEQIDISDWKKKHDYK